MSSEIIQSVAYDNYDNFQHATSYFHKKSFHYFDNYLMTNLTLKYGIHLLSINKNILDFNTPRCHVTYKKTNAKIKLAKYIMLKSIKNIIHVISITLWKKLDNNIFKVYVNY